MTRLLDVLLRLGGIAFSGFFAWYLFTWNPYLGGFAFVAVLLGGTRALISALRR